MAKEQATENVEMGLLKAKLQLLEGKISKPQSSEDAFQAREAAYDSKRQEREELKLKIEKRRTEIMLMPELGGKAKLEDIVKLEAWERRSKELEKSNPAYSKLLMNEFKRKIKEIKTRN